MSNSSSTKDDTLTVLFEPLTEVQNKGVCESRQNQGPFVNNWGTRFPFQMQPQPLDGNMNQATKCSSCFCEPLVLGASPERGLKTIIGWIR